MQSHKSKHEPHSHIVNKQCHTHAHTRNEIYSNINQFWFHFKIFIAEKKSNRKICRASLQNHADYDRTVWICMPLSVHFDRFAIRETRQKSIIELIRSNSNEPQNKT